MTTSGRGATHQGDIDPVLAAVMQKRVEAITLEMANALLRTTRSTIFNQVGDFITAIFDGNARTLAQTEFAAIIAFGAQPSLEAVIEYFGDDIHEGDVIAHNDVFRRGNQNHDLGFYLPVFWEGEIASWVACKGHQADLGGATAGGYNPRIREVWQEALRVPPLKIYDRGVLRRDVWDFIGANVRLEIVMEDIKSMIGACHVGVRRLTKTIERYGLSRFLRHMDYVIAYSERLVRADVATWPNGRYRGESVMVSDGVVPTSQHRIVCEVTIDDDEVTFDFTETDDQTAGYANMPASSAMGAVRIAFLMLLNAGGVEVPANQGLFAPVRTVFRPGSLLDPQFPAATIFGNQMCDEVLESIMRALAPVLPERVVSGWNQALGTVFEGIDPRTGDQKIFFGAFARGGPGAVYGSDGFDALGFTGAAGQMRCPDIETYELSNPVFMESYELTPDSAGAGRWRGGMGTTTTKIMQADRLAGSTLGDDVAAEGALPAEGIFGGEPAGLNELRLEFPDGTVRYWGSKESIDSIPPRTRLVQVTGGGAGYGDPFTRPAEIVALEVHEGLLSIEKARRSYGVVVDQNGLIDEQATAAARGALAGRDPVSVDPIATETRKMRYRVGIDSGGTFTDLLVLDDAGGRLVQKVGSTPDDPARAVVGGLAEAAQRLEMPAHEFIANIDLVVHGTTVATNAFLTRSGAVCGLLCTAGFRDTLPLRDGRREEPYNNRLPSPIPLVARHLRLPVPGRLDYSGAEIVSLDEHAVRRAIDSFREHGVEAVTVCLVHSPANPEHEQRVGELVRELLPDSFLTISSDLISQAGLFDRTSTAVLNSYVAPIIGRYLASLASQLRQAGFTGSLLLMQSNGGVATPDVLAGKAALSLLSGPASGPAAGLSVVTPLGHRDCITIDMGGTSFDAAIVQDGAALVKTDGWLDRWRLSLPMLDVHTIGAGGGSVAFVNAGMLQLARSAPALSLAPPATIVAASTQPSPMLI